LIQAAEELAQDVGVARATDVLGVPRATLYRHRGSPQPSSAPPRKPSPRALTADERDRIRAVLYEERFVDKSPREIYAKLLDEGLYLCSVRSLYRLLAREHASRERRDQLRHPAYKKPELLAVAPNQVWSWDITKLKGPRKWEYFQLYVILDIFSRYVVGWMLAHREAAELASRLIRETVQKQGVDADQLTIHSDRGAAMASQSVAQLLASLGVVKSHSRPHVSNDNPFSESQFKTLKYMPEFPERFGSHEHALSHCRHFFQWYNDDHYHTGVALLTPTMLHYGRADEVIRQRQTVLSGAYAQHPERFVRGAPVHAPVPTAVWINPPPEDRQEKDGLPEANCPQKPSAPLAHSQPGYPSSSCVPAELDCVSPSEPSVLKRRHQKQPLDTHHAEKNPGGMGAEPPGDGRDPPGYNAH